MVSNIVLFSSLFGEMIQFDEHIFQMGWNHQLEGPTCLFLIKYIEIIHCLVSTCCWNRTFWNGWECIFETTVKLSTTSIYHGIALL